MSKLHYMAPTAPAKTPFTARLGATGSANNYSTLDEGKPVKLAAESQYNLTALGDEIEGFIFGVDTATSGGFSVGSIVEDGLVWVTFNGLQSSPGTGTLAIGEYVVAGAPVPKGTALTAFPVVLKATAAGSGLNYKWRIVSFGTNTINPGAVGTTGVIKRVI